LCLDFLGPYFGPPALRLNKKHVRRMSKQKGGLSEAADTSTGRSSKKAPERGGGAEVVDRPAAAPSCTWRSTWATGFCFNPALHYRELFRFHSAGDFFRLIYLFWLFLNFQA